jgi:hypothetical protein
MPGQQPAQADTSKSRIRLLQENTAQWGMPTIRVYQDQYGVYCVKIKTSRGPVYCITKAYPYQEMASFPARVVRRAAANDCPVAVFFDTPRLGNAYVYLADQVLADGSPNKDTKPSERRQTWLDIPLEDGVLFGDWISDRADLPPITTPS